MIAIDRARWVALFGEFSEKTLKLASSWWAAEIRIILVKLLVENHFCKNRHFRKISKKSSFFCRRRFVVDIRRPKPIIMSIPHDRPSRAITVVQGKSGPFLGPLLVHFQVPFWVHFWFIFRSLFGSTFGSFLGQFSIQNWAFLPHGMHPGLWSTSGCNCGVVCLRQNGDDKIIPIFLIRKKLTFFIFWYIPGVFLVGLLVSCLFLSVVFLKILAPKRPEFFFLRLRRCCFP